jgi:hypothetical protein
VRCDFIEPQVWQQEKRFEEPSLGGPFGVLYHLRIENLLVADMSHCVTVSSFDKWLMDDCWQWLPQLGEG